MMMTIMRREKDKVCANCGKAQADGEKRVYMRFGRVGEARQGI